MFKNSRVINQMLEESSQVMEETSLTLKRDYRIDETNGIKL